MRKLKLDPDALRVETFGASAASTAPRGTVASRSWVSDVVNACSEPASQYCQPTDYHWNTCGSSCVEMCLASADPSCRC